LVRAADLKEQLAATAMLGAGNSYRVRDCSALAVFLADGEPSRRVDRIMALEKGQRHPAYRAAMPLASSFLMGEGHAATLLKQLTTTLVSQTLGQAMPGIESLQAWSYKNTALAVQSYVLAATSHDLATAIMEGYDPRRAKDILRIPDRYEIPMMVAMGYDYVVEGGGDTWSRTPRLELEEVVFGDTFGAPLELFHDGSSEEGVGEDDDDEKAV
jgi:nitroreductase